MAQSNNRRTPSGKSGATSKGVQPKAGQPKTPQPKTAAAKGSPAAKKPAAGRQSVAAARRSSNGNNRTQLIIGAIAVVVIIAIIIFGLVLNKKQTAVQGEGYGASTQSVATVAEGVVTVAKPGATPGKTIDVFEDALCPICSEFERQFGQQMNQAIDQGDLAVNYHMLNFLNPRSFSGDYSTRAAAALLCVAQEGGTQPGLYLDYHSALFSTDNQPAEGGSADLTNEQLAELATTTGAPASAASCITRRDEHRRSRRGGRRIVGGAAGRHRPDRHPDGAVQRRPGQHHRRLAEHAARPVNGRWNGAGGRLGRGAAA